MRQRMVNIPGAGCFFTINIAVRNKSIIINYIDKSREVLKKIKKISAL